MTRFTALSDLHGHRGGCVLEQQPPMPEIAGVEFRNVVGYSGYIVGSDGSIWSCRNFRGTFRSEWRARKPSVDKDGYRMITLRRDRKPVTLRLSAVVLEAFIGPRPDGTVSCHFPDTNLANNRADNLRWDTQHGNIQDKRICGTIAAGETHGMARLTEADVLEIRRRRVDGATTRELGDKYKVARAHISGICTGKYWPHVGGPRSRCGKVIL